VTLTKAVATTRDGEGRASSITPLQVNADVECRRLQDLAELEPVFDSPMITVEDESERDGELRLQSLGTLRGRVVFLVWTPRGDDTAHLISCRVTKSTQRRNMPPCSRFGGSPPFLWRSE
jgi:uncharacterized DUF497 family protein